MVEIRQDHDGMKKAVNPRKAAVIGCGFVGSAAAFSLMESGLFTELLLIDADKRKAEGEAMDISHGAPFSRPMNISAGEYEEIADAAIAVLTAGANQKPNESRLQLVQKNTAILRSIAAKLRQVHFGGILLVVANPVDILTYEAVKETGFPANRVIGSGTVLDTARLKYEIGQELMVDSRSVHAFIIGEHGDSEIAVFSSANVSGIPIDDFCRMRGKRAHIDEIAARVKNSAYEIISRKQVTNYGIAAAVRRICTAIVRDEKSILPVSSLMRGGFGIDDIALSMPAIVGADGVEKLVPLSLNESELAALQKSAALLKEIAKQV